MNESIENYEKGREVMSKKTEEQTKPKQDENVQTASVVDVTNHSSGGYVQKLGVLMNAYEGGMTDQECARLTRELWLSADDAPPLDYRVGGGRLAGAALAFMTHELLLDGEKMPYVFYLNKQTKTCFTYALPEPLSGPMYFKQAFEEMPELRSQYELTEDGVLYKIVKFEKLEIREKV